MEKMLWPRLSLTFTSFVQQSPTAPCSYQGLSRANWSSLSLRSFAGKRRNIVFFIIPFFRNISDIFDKCADNTEGKVANYIPQVSLVNSSLPHSQYNVDTSSVGEDRPCKVGSKVSAKWVR